jgi:sarcosine oxidase
MLFDGPVLFHPEAGVADADAAVAAWVRRVGERGGRVLAHTTVRAVAPAGGGALVHTDGPTVAADAVVVAAGPWLPELAAALGPAAGAALPPLRVTQQQVFHFRHRDPGAAWPTMVHKHLPDRPGSDGSGPDGSGPGGPGLQLYGLPSGADGGAAPAFKVAEHDRGTPTGASTRDGVVDPASRARIVDHVSRRLPGLDPAPVAEATCLYTTTPDDGFVLDRVGPVVVVSPCSGHGAKFAPLVGALAADLALGGAPHPRFALPARAVVP